MRRVTIFLGLIGMIGALVFWREVWGLFTGMTAVEALKQVVSFILHVTVATICGYVMFGLPGIVKPWVRMLRRSGRRNKGRRFEGFQLPKVERVSKGRELSTALALLAKQNGIKQSPAATVRAEEPVIKIGF